MASVLEIKESVEKSIMSIPGVAGIGVGRSSPEKIHIYLKTSCPNCIDQIPDEIGGVPTEIIVIGNVTTLAQQQMAPLSVSRTAKYRPCLGGVSIGHKDITAGTMGIVCYDNNTGEPFLLSNNHVFANEASIQIPGGVAGDAIVQPGVFDGGTVESDTLATLEKTSILDITGDNEFDCAIARPLSVTDISSTILDIGVVTQMGEPYINDVVRKSGRTTGLTESQIVDVNATIKVSYSKLGEVTFKNQIIIYPAFADGGDSGSICVRKRDNAAVGLLVAGSETISIANKMIGVANHMNINIGGGTVPPLAEIVSQESVWAPVAALGTLGLLYLELRKK